MINNTKYQLKFANQIVTDNVYENFFTPRPNNHANWLKFRNL